MVKKNTSRAREENNGTHMTESLALAEVEISLRVAMVRATGATPMMLSSKAMKFLKVHLSRRLKLKEKNLRLKKMRPRKIPPKRNPREKKLLILKRKKTRVSSLFKNTSLKRRR